jgi:hypothetical protein
VSTLSKGESDIVQIPGQRPMTCESLEKQVTCCSLLHSIENTGISENVAGSRGSQNLFQLQTIILSSFLDNSPCKVSEFFEPRVLRYKGLAISDSAPNFLVCLRFLVPNTISSSTTSFTARSFKSTGITRPQYSESSLARLRPLVLAGLLLSQYHESV